MLRLTDKFRDFVFQDSFVDILEGTTNAGKTTVGAFKFMLMCKQSKKRHHLIAGLDLGTIEKNIINPEYGLLDLFDGDLIYYRNGHQDVSMPHLRIGDEIIYLAGYNDVSKYKKILGGQYGAVMIDEINTAAMGFIREIFLPRFEYLLATLNPDDPKKQIYTEYIDRSRPTEKYKDIIPVQMQKLQAKQDFVKNWHYWFFTYDDNAVMTAETKEKLLTSTKKGTVAYKTKIEGVRTKAVGIIFYTRPRNIITPAEAKAMTFVQYTAGLDTSYSQKTEDTLAWTYGGITNERRYVYLDEITANNKVAKPIIIKGKLYNPFSSNKGQIAPSDTTHITNAFMMKNKDDYGFTRQIFIDSADAATYSETTKAIYRNGWIFDAVKSYKIAILDRIILQNKWMASGHYLIVDTNRDHIDELNNYAWDADKDNVPEDGNDHTINSSQYNWIPYRQLIGG